MNWILVRGAGDIATGTLLRLKRCGFSVAALETDAPSAIRRTVSFSEAIYDGQTTVEGFSARLISTLPEKPTDWIPILIDPAGNTIHACHPTAVVDAILAKQNLGTTIHMAPVTVALGPGFCAGQDVHAVVETKRGHTLGRVLWNGPAASNTGIPGVVNGFGAERVIHAPVDGFLQIIKDIGSIVEKGDVIAYLDKTPVYASISGLVRGMLREGFHVSPGMKMADIDPRTDTDWHTVSDKALAVAGGVLEALLAMGVRP